MWYTMHLVEVPPVYSILVTHIQAMWCAMYPVEVAWGDQASVRWAWHPPVSRHSTQSQPQLQPQQPTSELCSYRINTHLITVTALCVGVMRYLE